MFKFASWSARPQMFSIWPFTENICWWSCTRPQAFARMEPGSKSLALPYTTSQPVSNEQWLGIKASLGLLKRGTMAEVQKRIPTHLWAGAGSVPDHCDKPSPNLFAGGGSCLPRVKYTPAMELKRKHALKQGVPMVFSSAMEGLGSETGSSLTSF